ncbi:hypothetical protein MGA3_16466 [Bacillus methanolicus MGA3]|uniref:Uncharacterized protein n=1 Tax=Bacillus methanolicus (strain MGA3 / ATCC 53907) TaxID=796606 RepID=I3DUP1_BACMM|nr:hypothetical protein BMMGA3_14010 [Bacillus methanolicus MGA3]EIJ77962.1 hypothetical protein MGA3_16466 [Bacillus methanolicus MGA3]
MIAGDVKELSNDQTSILIKHSLVIQQINFQEEKTDVDEPLAVQIGTKLKRKSPVYTKK